MGKASFAMEKADFEKAQASKQGPATHANRNNVRVVCRSDTAETRLPGPESSGVGLITQKGTSVVGQP